MNLITIYLSLLLHLFYPSKVDEKDVAEIDVCLSQEEMQLYLLINEYRKQKKLPPVALSQALTKVAKAHAVDLVNHYDIADRDKCNPIAGRTKDHGDRAVIPMTIKTRNACGKSLKK